VLCLWLATGLTPFNPLGAMCFDHGDAREHPRRVSVLQRVPQGVSALQTAPQWGVSALQRAPQAVSALQRAPQGGAISTGFP
jgi:hypothetical protein